MPDIRAASPRRRKERELKAPYFLLSHHDGSIRKKEDVPAELETICSRRDPQDPYIFVS